MNETNLRDQKKARTRDALMRHGLRIFAEQGYDETTVDEVAEAAGVSRRTFFRYFATKEALVFANQPARLERFRRVLEVRVEGESPFDAVHRALMAIGRDYTRNRDEILERQALVDATPSLIAVENGMDREWEAAIEGAVVARTADDAASIRTARLFAAAALGVIRVTLREWRESGATVDLEALGDENLSRLVAGFSLSG